MVFHLSASNFDMSQLSLSICLFLTLSRSPPLSFPYIAHPLSRLSSAHSLSPMCISLSQTPLPPVDVSHSHRKVYLIDPFAVLDPAEFGAYGFRTGDDAFLPLPDADFRPRPPSSPPPSCSPFFQADRPGVQTFGGQKIPWRVR